MKRGENTRDVLNIAKRNSNLKSISQLASNDNAITDDSETILNEMKMYYEK